MTAAKRFKRVEHATAVIWKMRMAGGRFLRLNAQESLKKVYHGADNVNGVQVTERAREIAA